MIKKSIFLIMTLSFIGIISFNTSLYAVFGVKTDGGSGGGITSETDPIFKSSAPVTYPYRTEVDNKFNKVAIDTTTIDNLRISQDNLIGQTTQQLRNDLNNVAVSTGIKSYVYTILLREQNSNGSDTTTSSSWEDKLATTGKWAQFVDSSTIVSAKLYAYFQLASTATVCVVSGQVYLSNGSGTRIYGVRRDTATINSSTYAQYPEAIDIPASYFDPQYTNLDLGLQTKSDDGYTVYYQMDRCYLVVKTREREE